jgi:hypothetical protein
MIITEAIFDNFAIQTEPEQLYVYKLINNDCRLAINSRDCSSDPKNDAKLLSTNDQ